MEKYCYGFDTINDDLFLFGKPTSVDLLDQETANMQNSDELISKYLIDISMMASSVKKINLTTYQAYTIFYKNDRLKYMDWLKPYLKAIHHLDQSKVNQVMARFTNNELSEMYSNSKISTDYMLMLK